MSPDANWGETVRRFHGRFAAAILTAALAVGTGAGLLGQVPSASAAASKPFKVMVIGTFTGAQSYSVPEIVTAVKAAFSGSKGVTVLSCDDQASASAGLTCEHDAVADHVAVVIAGFAEVASNESILAQAGIPVVGTTDTTSPVSFATANGTGEYAGIGVGLAKTGCKRLGILYLDGTDVLANSIIDSAKWQSVTEAAIPFNAPDLTPSIAKLAEAKVQCIAVSVEPNTVIQAMIAIKQNGLHVRVAMVSAILTTQVLSSLGAQATGLVGVEGNVDPLDKAAPVIATIKKQMKAVSPKAPVTSAAVTAWGSAKIVQDAVANVKGSVTAASLLKALNGLRNASSDGVFPPLSMVPLPNPAYKRFFNHYVILYQIKKGAPVRLTGFLDLSPALKS
jgi:hypothetical protein